jgi:hypothetical protein
VRNLIVSFLIPAADVVDKGLKLTGVLLGAVGVGSALGVTAGILVRRPREQTEMWGLTGTAIGFLAGVLLMICVWALSPSD